MMTRLANDDTPKCLGMASKQADVRAVITEAAALYTDVARSLAETGRCRVVLCARPKEIREHDSGPLYLVRIGTSTSLICRPRSLR